LMLYLGTNLKINNLWNINWKKTEFKIID
jgi:hypothetical protein